MKFWQQRTLALAMAALLMVFAVATAAAQDGDRGKLAGAVYTDVNGDGLCVGTGVAGENPVPGVEIVFVSSDKATVLSLTTGSDGTYGLAAAGQSIWEVTARPDASKWIVTSKNPLFVPVLPENGLVQTDVNFCVSQGTNAIIVLPQSGASAANQGQTIVTTAVNSAAIGAIIGGVLLMAAGIVLERRRRSA
jgi:hypothetical protein